MKSSLSQATTNIALDPPIQPPAPLGSGKIFYNIFLYYLVCKAKSLSSTEEITYSFLMTKWKVQALKITKRFSEIFCRCSKNPQRINCLKTLFITQLMLNSKFYLHYRADSTKLTMDGAPEMQLLQQF